MVSFLMVFTSCVTQRDVEYMQDKSDSIKAYKEAFVGEYQLKPNDDLFIQISSLDDPSAGLFGSSGGTQPFYSGSILPYGASLVSYTVDKEGYVQLPVIGRIFVMGQTTSQVSELLKNSLTNILSQPVVSVKLVNRYVSVLGEVRIPGHYVYSQDKLTIYDAIGLAGDITDFGNRKEVILVRNENGENIRISVDLTQTDILTSDYYLVRPNDFIYVRPLEKKFWNMRQFPYAVVLSTITTAVLFYSVIHR